MLVTINDVAGKAGVSNAMVSMALNDHPKVSQRRKEQIRQIADDLGYRPSMIAQNLLGRKTSLVGVLLPSAAYSGVLAELESHLRQFGYNMIACVTNHDLTIERQDIDMLMRRGVEGIIVLPMVKREHEEYEHLLAPLKHDIPLVFVDHHTPDARLPRVTTDDAADVQTMMRHLLGLGHRRIAFAHIGLHEWDHCLMQMHQGYKTALAQASLAYDDSLVVQCGAVSTDETKTFWPDTVAMLLDRQDRPDAILAYTDMLAIKMMSVIHTKGLRLPQDIAMAGISNHVMAPYTLPPLTSLQRGTEKMCRRAVDMVMHLIKQADPYCLPVYERFAGDLVVRQSSGVV
jgi:LacI family transcriptional regulator